MIVKFYASDYDSYSDFAYDSVAYDQVKIRLSELQAEANELNQSPSVETCILLPTPTIWFSLDRKRRSRKQSQIWKRSDSSDSDSVALLTLLTTNKILP